MQLSYLIPENRYEFFKEILPLLTDAGIQVNVNNIGRQTDIILAGILPATSEWAERIVDSGKPFILWHWDYYSSTDYSQHRWKSFLKMLPDASDIWSCSYETARQLKETFGLDSYMIPAWIDARNLPKSTATQSYILYAASSCAFGKRIEWAERACTLLRLPLRLLKRQSLSRPDYFNIMAKCGIYLMTAFEESNGSIPAMEAAALGKSVVVADIPSNREVFGNTEGVFYFDAWDFSHLLETVRTAWSVSTTERPYLRQRMHRLYGLDSVAKRFIRRIKDICNA